MKKKVLSLILASAMVATMFAGCGKKEEAAAPAEDTKTEAASDDAEEETASAEDAGSDVADGFVPAAVPEVPDLGGQSPNEYLINQSDKLCLSGVVSNHFDNRDQIYKGLDKVDTSKDESDVKVAVMMASLGTTFFTTMQSAIQERCDMYGYTPTFFDANFDLGTQQDQFEQILAGEYDFIICNAVDIDATADLYRQASEMGKPVIVTGPTAAQQEYQILTTIISSSWAAGEATGEYTAEYCWGKYPEGLKWGAVVDKIGDADSESRPNGFIAGYLYKYAELAGTPYESKWDAAVVAYELWKQFRDNGKCEVPGIMNMVGYLCTNNIATSAAAPKCAELLSAHPDMDMAFVETDSFGLAMITEMQQNGIKPGEDMLVVYAADGTAELCESIKKGEVLCIGVNVPTLNAYGMVDVLHNIMTGVDCNDLPANSYTSTYAVTPDNIDEAYTEGNAYANPPEFTLMTTDEYNEANA